MNQNDEGTYHLKNVFLECVDGFYNITCSAKCGNCLSGVCNKLSGACHTGCQRNFHAPMCQGSDFTCKTVLFSVTVYGVFFNLKIKDFKYHDVKMFLLRERLKSIKIMRNSLSIFFNLQSLNSTD